MLLDWRRFHLRHRRRFHRPIPHRSRCVEWTKKVVRCLQVLTALVGAACASMAFRSVSTSLGSCSAVGTLRSASVWLHPLPHLHLMLNMEKLRSLRTDLPMLLLPLPPLALVLLQPLLVMLLDLSIQHPLARGTRFYRRHRNLLRKHA